MTGALADLVELWLVDLDDEGWPDSRQLPADERERARRLASDQLRRRWAASRWALRSVLAARTGTEPAALRFELGSAGKPRLPGGPHFNLSHSGGLALIALAGAEVGVDLERVDPRREVLSLAPRALGEDGAATLREVPEQQRLGAFHRAWTRREALLKCSGAGLGGGSPRPGNVVVSLSAPPGYAAALALAGDSVPPRHWRRLGPGPA